MQIKLTVHEAKGGLLFLSMSIFAFFNLSYTDGVLQDAIIYSISNYITCIYSILSNTKVIFLPGILA